MADQHANEGSSASNTFGTSSDSTFELNVKTLDSQVYSFQVENNMPVSLFKEKIANQIGLPVGQQRLIFRGKVLKDDHPLSEYHVENGDTLHLVERQQPQAQSDAASRDTSGSTDNRENDDFPRNRVGQIAHSVLLGTFNVGEQGEGAVPDIGRVIGAVLNSIGVGQPGSNGTGPVPFTSVQSNAPSQVSQVNGNNNAQNQGGTQAQTGEAFSTQPVPSMPQVVQIPLAAAAVPVSLASLQTPIPHSLNTLSEFMNRMEQALTQNGYQPNLLSTNSSDLPRVELPSNSQGMPTTEALTIVLRHAQQLLSSHAIEALSHLAGRLEQEGTSSDATTRGQIQSQALQIGLAMQHIGSLLLELGRTTMTLHMGQYPMEPVVNAGPAVYISPTGPNPIMVQPSLLQTSSFVGGPVPSNPVTSGPVGVGNPPRNINIHIHAGTSLAPRVSTLGSRASSGEGTQRGQGNAAGSADLAAIRALSASNVVGTAAPSHAAGAAISSAAQPSVVVSASQPSASVSLSSLISDVNARLQNMVGSVHGQNQGQSGQTGSTVQSFVCSGADGGSGQHRNELISGVQGSSASLSESLNNESTKDTNYKDRSESSLKDVSLHSSGESLVGPSKGNEVGSEEASDAVRLNEKHDTSEEARSVPLGLGLGGLERKTSRRQPKGSNNGSTSAPSDQNQNARVSGQQVLQALASRSSGANRSDTHNQPLVQPPLNSGEPDESRRSGRQGSGGSFDVASAMSQVLQNPALNGLLAGVSGQAGVGSTDGLRSMMQQLTQNPTMMNAVSQIAEQVDEREIENMFSGAGRGQGGGMDFSRMIQQMMPIVSQALSSRSNPTQESPALGPEHEVQHERRVTGDDQLDDQKIDLHGVTQRIQQLDAPEDVFRSMVENAVQLYSSERLPADFLDALCSDRGLASAYVQMLLNDLSGHLQED